MSHTLRVDGRTLTLRIHETLPALHELRPAWKELLSKSASDSAFLTWEWLITWSERFIRNGRRAFVLTVADGDQLIGLAPWYIDQVNHGPIRVREVGFLGLPEAGSDYLDVIARRGKEQVAAQALLSVLFTELSSRWDTLSLNEIPAESTFLAHLISNLRESGKHYWVSESSFCPGVVLPDTVDAYLSQLTGHSRQAFRRKLRRLFRDQRATHTILKNGDVGRMLPVFRDLHGKRWGDFHGELFDLIADYLPRATEAWRVELSLISVGERPIAGLLHLARGRRMYQYLMAVDKSFNKRLSIGNLICGLNIQAAIEGGYREYDFLKGQELYKLKFMNQARRSLKITLHNRTARSLSAWAFDAAKRLTKIVIR